MASPSERRSTTQPPADPRDELDRKRIEAGVCRHCGDPVPCWSEFGDQSVGVRHTVRSWKRFRAGGAAS